MKTYCWDILELSWRSLKLQTLIKGSWDSVVFPSRWWIENLSLVEFKGFFFFRFFVSREKNVLQQQQNTPFEIDLLHL